MCMRSVSFIAVRINEMESRKKHGNEFYSHFYLVCALLTHALALSLFCLLLSYCQNAFIRPQPFFNAYTFFITYSLSLILAHMRFLLLLTQVFLLRPIKEAMELYVRRTRCSFVIPYCLGCTRAYNECCFFFHRSFCRNELTDQNTFQLKICVYVCVFHFALLHKYNKNGFLPTMIDRSIKI